MIQKAIISLLILASTFSGQGQSSASNYLIDNFNERYLTVVSESIIRAVINFADSSGNLKSLGTNLEKVIYFKLQDGTTPEHTPSPEKKVEELVNLEGFELLMNLQQKSATFALFVLEENGETQSVVVLGNANEAFHFLEIIGNLDLAYLMKTFGGLSQGESNGKDQILDLAKLLNIDL